VRSSRVAVLYSPVTRCFAASAFTCLRSWWFAIEFRTRKDHAGRNKYNNNNSDTSNSDKINSKSKKELVSVYRSAAGNSARDKCECERAQPTVGDVSGDYIRGKSA